MEMKELIIVDNDPDHRYLLRQIFINYLPEYRVTILDGGEELFKLLKERAQSQVDGDLPAAIIVDCLMPYYRGTEVLYMLKGHPERDLRVATIPVIMMSNDRSEKMVSACYAAGAAAFVKKPINFIDIKDLLVLMCQFWVDANIRPAGMTLV